MDQIFEIVAELVAEGLTILMVEQNAVRAIEAALSPADGTWIFFITVKPGDTRFTASESEFYRWKSEYDKNYASGAFKVGA